MKDFNLIKTFLEKEMHNNSYSSIESISSEDTRGNSSINSSIRSYTKRQIEDIDKQWGQAALKCDIIRMKELYAQDQTVLDKRDYFTGYAAAHWAAKKGRADILDWLNDHHADINLRTNGGYTPLHIAAMHGKMKTILRLVKDCEANPNIRDYGGRKASHYVTDDVTEDVKDALNIGDSLLSSKNDSILSQALSKSTQAIDGNLVLDHSKIEDSFKKKKRSLSITQSFKHRRRKMLLEKRNSDFDGSVSPAISTHQRKSRSMSAQDDLTKSFQRQMSIKRDPYYHTLDTYRKKSFASENVINGYAGYLTNSKCRRQMPSDQSLDNMGGTQWGINTWV